MDTPTLRPVLLCTLSLVLLSSAFAGAAATSAAGSTAVDAATPINGTVGESAGTTNETEATPTGTTETLAGTTETVDGVTDTLDEATNETTGTLDETTDELGETVTATTDTVGDAVDDTTDETGDAVDGTTDVIDDATNSSTVGETTGTIDDTVEGTTDGLDGVVNGTTDAVDATVDETTEELDDTVEGTTDGLDDAVDEATADSDEPVDRTSTASDGTVDGVTYALHETGSPWTAQVHPEGTTRRGGTYRSGTESVTPAPAHVSDGDRDNRDDRAVAATTGGGTRPSGSGVGAGVDGLLVVAVLSSSLAATGGPLGSSSPAWSQSGRVALRVLRAGANQPWRHVVLALRFSRHDDSDPLEHDRRRTIYDRITDDPGVYLSALGEHSDLSLSAVRHHLRILDRENLIETEKVRGKRRFYPVGTGETTRAAALSDPAVRPLLETLAALGEARNDRLADELDRSPSTVSHHLSSLEEDGIVVRERDGRTTVNRLAPTVANTLGETALDGDATVERPHSDD